MEKGAESARLVAIIGAGVSGLTAVKCCLDEGLHPVCYELTGDIGGLWNYREDLVDENVSSVMKSTVINTSKEMMAYSDFPMPAEWPNFLHNTQVLEYLRLYTRKFGLHKYIAYRERVNRIQRCEEHNGKNWLLEIENIQDGSIRKESFDAVFIATGHHAKPNRPKFDGLDTFTGEVLHTHDYRGTASRFDNKTVLVIGIGNSGGDVAVEISRLTKQTYVCTRRGAWIFHRIGEGGVPLDTIFIRRSWELVKKIVDLNRIMAWYLTWRFDHETYGLKPEYGPMNAHPTINDELPNRLACGLIVIKPNLVRIEGSTVHFSDGSHIDHVDTIVMATGYHVTFPFMQDQIFEFYDNHVELYKYVFPPNDTTGSMAVLGCIQPWGALMPISEMQARLACKVFKKKVRLPPRDAMLEDIRKKERAMNERYSKSPRHTIQVDFVPYMDEMASLVGCRPQLGKLFLTDRTLWYHVLFGPATPYQYRIHGPNAWKEARSAITSQWDRIASPIKPRTFRASKPQISRCHSCIKVIFIMLILSMIYYAVTSN